MKPKTIKFLFTQLSAPIIGFSALFFGIYLAKKMFPTFFMDFNFFKIVLIGTSYIALLLGSMILWGKILISIGILTKEEGKGYPYSKPWEDDSHL
ncbi:MAG: hypothetical protein KKE61_16885 [Proteobacteria bacterium]|nr:hypothetical protein [Pseudomonadota bacterium]